MLGLVEQLKFRFCEYSLVYVYLFTVEENWSIGSSNMYWRRAALEKQKMVLSLGKDKLSSMSVFEFMSNFRP